jgi:hypothetical protein
MKKLFIFLASFFIFSSFAFALDMDVWLSSNTATADPAGLLCGMYAVGTSSVVYHSVIHSVVVSSTATGAGFLTLYNSTFTTTGSQSLGPINMQAIVPNYNYDVTFPNGLFYVKTGTGQAQILYQCY